MTNYSATRPFVSSLQFHSIRVTLLLTCNPLKYFFLYFYRFVSYSLLVQFKYVFLLLLFSFFFFLISCKFSFLFTIIILHVIIFYYKSYTYQETRLHFERSLTAWENAIWLVESRDDEKYAQVRRREKGKSVFYMLKCINKGLRLMVKVLNLWGDCLVKGFFH